MAGHAGECGVCVSRAQVCTPVRAGLRECMGVCTPVRKCVRVGVSRCVSVHAPCMHSTPGAWPETDDFTMSWGHSAFWKSPCVQWHWEWGNGTGLRECLLYTVSLDQLHVRKEAGPREGLLQTRSDGVCVSHLWKPVPGFKENKVSWHHLHHLLHRGSASSF